MRETKKYNLDTLEVDRDQGTKIYPYDYVYCEVLDIENTNAHDWKMEEIMKVPKKLGFTDRQIKYMVKSIGIHSNLAYYEGKAQNKKELREFLEIDLGLEKF